MSSAAPSDLPPPAANPARESLLALLGLDELVAAMKADSRPVATSDMLRGLHYVFERERSGTWRGAMKSSGHSAGRTIALDLEARLVAAHRPKLAQLPLEAALALFERRFASEGWGRLGLDLSAAAEHGLVVARLEHSSFVEALPDAPGFVDAFPAGMLQGFFEYISGQTLACEEIACALRGAPHCTFVITAPERLATAMPRLGRDSAEAIIALLSS